MSISLVSSKLLSPTCTSVAAGVVRQAGCYCHGSTPVNVAFLAVNGEHEKEGKYARQHDENRGARIERDGLMKRTKGLR